MCEDRNDVIVGPVPEIVDARQHAAFIQDLASRMSTYRPRIVLDCSAVETMNLPTACLLLSCLEEALKRNGDARLAGVSSQARTFLERARADQLFLIFNSITEAVDSFERSAAALTLDGETQGDENEPSENAA